MMLCMFSNLRENGAPKFEVSYRHLFCNGLGFHVVVIFPEWRTKSILMRFWKMPPSLNVSKPTLQLLNHSLCFKGLVAGNRGGEKSFTSNAYGHIISMITYEREWDPGKTSWFIQTHKSSKGGGYPIFLLNSSRKFPMP